MNRSTPSVLAALALWAGAAGAETSPWFLGVSHTVTRDNNVLYLGDNQVAPAGYSRSDTVQSTALLAGFDQPFGRQHGYANLAVRRNRYADNPIFDNVGYNAVAGLDWSTINRISGTVLAQASRNLQRFGSPEIGFLGNRNLETVKALNATASIGVVTRYSLELGVGHRSVDDSLQQPAVQANASSQNDVSVGARWRPSAASSFGLGAGYARGRFPRFRNLAAAGEEPAYQGDRYRRRNVEFSAALVPSGASNLDLRIASGRTTYEINEQRNFSGVTGSFAWSWRPTGKTRSTLRYNRDTGQDSYATSYLDIVNNAFVSQATTLQSSRVVDALQWQLGWDASAKIGVTAGISYYDRKLVQTVGIPGSSPVDGRDKTTVYTVGLRWTPLRSASFGCDYSNQQRRGEGPLTSNLHGTSLGCFGQLTLQ